MTLPAGARALVTGGAGFIGSNLVKALVEKGVALTVLDNLSSGYRRNLEPFPDIRFIQADVRDARAVEEAIDGATFVFHLAASVGNKRSIDCPIADAEINVLPLVAGTVRRDRQQLPDMRPSGRGGREAIESHPMGACSNPPVRARLILMLANGAWCSMNEAATPCYRDYISRWRRCFLASRLDGLLRNLGSG